MEATSFTKLLESVKIGAMELRNRIVMPPMCTNFASETGAVTQRLIDYYVERAKGGVGLVTVEATCVDSPVGRLSPLQLCVDDDKFIGGLNDLVEAIQEKGAKISLQLHHAGRQTTLAATGGAQPVSSSETVYKGVKARTLPAEEIECVVERFGESAKRAKAAGFDAVEIHGAHGYLIAQFLSPYVNKRNDEYGGDPEKRMKFALEVLEETRKMVGLAFPIIFRLSGEEFVKDGLTLKETRRIAQRLERAGVDALHITAGVGGTIWPVQPMAVPKGCLVHLAEEIKEVVGIPVIAVGRINNPTLAEEILREGRADLVSMGRALIADPELPRKVAEGRLDDIRMCTACLRGCSERFNAYLRISCTVNPAVGREKEYMIKPADKPKKVLVVGGGPAGLEAARVAALRGHEVTLYEKSDSLGGQLLLASAAPHKEEVNNITNYLVHQIKKLGVKAELGVSVTPRTVKAMRPDVLIVATGGRPLVPNIPGIHRENVVTAWDILTGKVEVGGKVVVAGGGMIGCEAAEFLAERGREVVIVEMLDDIATDMPVRSKLLLAERLSRQGVKVLTNTEMVEVSEGSVDLIDGKGRKHRHKTDTVVLALGSVSNKELVEALRDRVRELYAVGDCVRPRKVLEAIREGSSVARAI